MKKTYIIPETLTVVLNAKTNVLMSTSLGDDTPQVEPGTPGEVKENVSGASGRNVWDEEW